MRPWVVCILCLSAKAAAQVPTIANILPCAAAPGRAVDVTVSGSNLDALAGAWTSFPARVSFPADQEQTSARATCRITAAPDVQVGIHALRVATRNGVSGLRLFMVDDLATVAATQGNGSTAAAQVLSPPVAVEGACDAGGSDFYKFHAGNGQRVAIEVVAARLGSQLDPVVRLLDGSGRELVWCDDSPGAGSDCRFARTFDADGDYVIELRDAGYGGGADYRYRLRVGDFPLANTSFPLGGKRGTAGMFSFVGPDCDGATPVTLIIPDVGGSVALGMKWAGARDGGSGFVSAAVGGLDESVESEPNDTPLAATRIAAPSAVSARLHSPNDRDFYELALAKGQRLLFRARTRSLGSPCDVLLQLYKADGSKLAESKVEGATEGTLDATVPSDGVYRLGVEEITRAGGPGLAYRLEVEPYRPGFSLGVETDTVQAKPGGTFEIKVSCVRRDYAGPISLEVQGFAAEVVEGATIAGGKNDTTLKVKTPAGLTPGTVVNFRITGTAKVGQAEYTATAGTMPALRKQFPRLLYPPEITDGIIALGVQRP